MNVPMDEDEFDALTTEQKDSYLRHPAVRPRCACRKYAVVFGKVDASDGFRHAARLCQPVREVIR